MKLIKPSQLMLVTGGTDQTSRGWTTPLASTGQSCMNQIVESGGLGAMAGAIGGPLGAFLGFIGGVTTAFVDSDECADVR